MRWQLQLLVVWCGVSIPSGLIGVAPSYAASPDAIDSPDEIRPISLAVAQVAVDPSSEGFQGDVLSSSVAVPESTVQFSPSASTLHAQTPSAPPSADPNDDRFLQPTPLPQPVAPSEQVPVVPTPTPAPTPPTAPTPPADAATVSVQRIEVTGSTIFDEDDFDPITAPYEGRSVTVGELRSVADQITQLYLDGGYITSRAVLVSDQDVTQGIIEIRVIEGSLESIEIEGNDRVNDGYIRSRVRLGGRTPLNQGRLEDQLRLLRLDPLFDNVEASLRAGSGLGQSILTVRVTESLPFTGNLSIDNYSPPSVGSERFGVAASLLSPTGLGDAVSASYTQSTTGGSNLFDFSYQVPLNPMNGTLQLRVAPSDYQITDPQFRQINIEGSADLYELSFRQPLIRTPREEFALSLGFTHRDGETLISDILADASTTSVIKFGQDYVRRDIEGAWALRSQFNFGTGLLDATDNPDPQPDGQFFSWLGQAQRVQILNQDHLLIVQADLQLTPDPLLASQQFVIGGGQSLRGFRQNVRTGDNGFRLSVEDRIAIQRNESGAPTLQLAPFADLGTVWNADDNPGDLPDQTFLAGVGLGVLWEPLPGLNIRLDYAVPLVDLEDRGNNAQDEAFYFSVNFQPR
ncbi:ShlB/FhaC/HecB family hemolysin secretion/activation protein [Oscillatoria sp. FACHB-1407]|uniref:ShlB/FhaC/HecB family hemolysin secretion/activation protein n=1 Tax=Oscillatoria sp. FACHB-1407 TaxID=2692847 RepID=UPI0016844136|nr:ShlB/FhaC/HecB family hemolysin secretion/activation protein [Oscillatoria sp. FACHB-1407]MBD2461615.1 ShlB/FhaC/HecB family hemolysin secretion/activation protein [Oscillatoria sp. FACHB-1407]